MKLSVRFFGRISVLVRDVGFKALGCGVWDVGRRKNAEPRSESSKPKILQALLFSHLLSNEDSSEAQSGALDNLPSS